MKNALLARGIVMPEPAAVTIGSDVVPERIHAGAVLHPGCRILGRETSIGPGTQLGTEGPVTLKNCQLGRDVKVGGGYLEGTTLLDGATTGDGLHARPGTLLEERSSVAHTVGLKQTILMPYVTLGSLINFCDILMAGGTGSKNHSEVGSSFIHFNFTPHQDKATASLIGDVPHGVFVDQPPIFLGGQGGMVGPCSVAYGTVLAAGSILRQDIREPGQLVFDPPLAAATRPYDASQVGRVARRVSNCLAYFGQLLALRAWYRLYREPLMRGTPWGQACWVGACQRLDEIWKERLKRLEQLQEKVVAQIETTQGTIQAEQRAFVAAWPKQREKLEALWQQSPEAERATFEAAGCTVDLQSEPTADYLASVKALNPEQKARWTTALSACADAVR